MAVNLCVETAPLDEHPACIKCTPDDGPLHLRQVGGGKTGCNILGVRSGRLQILMSDKIVCMLILYYVFRRMTLCAC